jgi:hypothetical protein
MAVEMDKATEITLVCTDFYRAYRNNISFQRRLEEMIFHIAFPLDRLTEFVYSALLTIEINNKNLKDKYADTEVLAQFLHNYIPEKERQRLITILRGRLEYPGHLLGAKYKCGNLLIHLFRWVLSYLAVNGTLPSCIGPWVINNSILFSESSHQSADDELQHSVLASVISEGSM